MFLDHNFAAIILCDKLFLQLKKKYFFQIFLFFLQVFIFFLDNKSSISGSNDKINILKKILKSKEYENIFSNIF